MESRISCTCGTARAGEIEKVYPLGLDGGILMPRAFDPRKAQVIELRFFGGLTVAETATALEVAPDTIARDWRMAKAWLARELAGG